MKAPYFLCFAFLILSFSCAVYKKPVKKAVVPLERRADEAWNNGDWHLAKNFYGQLLKKNISGTEKKRILKRFIVCCIRDKDFDAAEEYLERWKRWYPDFDSDWNWYELKGLLLKEKEGEAKFISYLKGISLGDYSDEIVSHGLKSLIKKYLSESADKLFDFFENWFKELEFPKQKELFVRRFLKYNGLSYDALGELAISIPSDSYFDVPYSLINWLKLIMDLEHRAITWAYAWNRLLNIIKNSEDDVKKVLEDDFKELVKGYGPLRLKVGLLLPLDGISISWKILKGAELAQVEFLSEGMDVEIEVVNTLNRDWKRYVWESECNIFGGVLRKSVWEIISNGDLFEKKIFFVFRSLERREKKNIFSFFPGYRDQIVPIVEFLGENFDVKKFAVFAPKSEYGFKMADIFEKVVKEKGYEVVKKGFYYPKRHALWKYQVAEFLGIPEEYFKDKDFDKESFSIKPEFQALFLPDTFGEAKILIPEFFFFDVNNVFFIGPILWSFENTKVSRIDSTFYRLALFCSPWNYMNEKLNERLSIYYLDSGSDFWVGLGYDFVRFSINMMTSIFKVNFKYIEDFLKNESFLFDWTISPIKWDEDLISSELMEIFQPSIRGPMKVSKKKLRDIFEARSRENKDKKEQKDEDNKE